MISRHFIEQRNYTRSNKITRSNEWRELQSHLLLRWMGRSYRPLILSFLRSIRSHTNTPIDCKLLLNQTTAESSPIWILHRILEQTRASQTQTHSKIWWTRLITTNTITIITWLLAHFPSLRCWIEKVKGSVFLHYSMTGELIRDTRRLHLNIALQGPVCMEWFPTRGNQRKEKYEG